MKLIHGLLPLDFDILVAKKYMNKVSSSRNRNIEFKLTLSEFRQILSKKRCAYTGIALTLHSGENVSPVNSDLTIERIDNSIGYVKGNCIAVCAAANGIKSVFETPETFLSVQDGIRMFATIDKLQKNMK